METKSKGGDDERNAVEERRRRATARFLLRLISVEQAHGIIRPDAEAFKARMIAQAKLGAR